MNADYPMNNILLRRQNYLDIDSGYLKKYLIPNLAIMEDKRL